jgi:hypothetical protein
MSTPAGEQPDSDPTVETKPVSHDQAEIPDWGEGQLFTGGARKPDEKRT